MGYHVIQGAEAAWEDRPGDPVRSAADVTSAAGLQQSRARLWRYPAGAKGRRHRNFQQEEVFVVLSGTLTMLLGEPADRVDVPAPGVVSVDPETPLQVFNAGGSGVGSTESPESGGAGLPAPGAGNELLLFIYGAPPAVDQSEMLDDLELD